MLLAYTLGAFSIIAVTDTAYILLNVFGAAAVAFEAYNKHDWQPVVLNGVWCGISLVALWQALGV